MDFQQIRNMYTFIPLYGLAVAHKGIYFRSCVHLVGLWRISRRHVAITVVVFCMMIAAAAVEIVAYIFQNK